MERIQIKELIDGKTINSIQHYNRYFFAKLFTYGNILDIACGIGYGSEVLGNQYIKYTGLDINQESIQIAKEHFEQENRNFLVGDIYNIQYRDNEFDAICVFETIEHLNNADNAINELKRVLKSNGIIIGSVPSKFYDDLIASKFQPNEFHLRQFDLSDIDNLISEHFKYKVVLASTEEVATRYAPLISNYEITKDSQTYVQQNQDIYGSYIFIATDSEETYKTVIAKLAKNTIKCSEPFMKVYFDNYHNDLVDYMNKSKIADEIEAENASYLKEIENLKKDIKNNINIVEELEDVIYLKNEKISKMENSRFWKIRNVYVEQRERRRAIIRKIIAKVKSLTIRMKKLSKEIIKLPKLIRIRIRPSKRIAMVCSTGAFGGAERVFAKHVEMLSKIYEVDVYFTMSGGPVADEIKELPVNIFFNEEVNDVTLADHQYIYLVQVIPDTIHIKKLNPSIKISYILHDPILWTNELAKQIRYTEKIDHIFCISNLIQKKLLEIIPSIKQEKTSILYNSFFFGNNEFLKSKEYPQDANTLTFGYAGRFSFEKNITGLLTAFKEFNLKYPKTKFIVAGDVSIKGSKKLNDYRIEIMKIMDSCKAIEYWGYKNELKEFYDKIDVLLMGSFIEGISVAALDALSFGIPVLSTDVGSMHEIIENGFNGILVPLSNTSENPFDDETQKFSNEDMQNFMSAMENILKKNWEHQKIAEKAIEKYSEMAIKKELLLQLEKLNIKA